jgi:hypothetical protein
MCKKKKKPETEKAKGKMNDMNDVNDVNDVNGVNRVNRVNRVNNVNVDKFDVDVTVNSAGVDKDFFQHQYESLRTEALKESMDFCFKGNGNGNGCGSGSGKGFGLLIQKGILGWIEVWLGSKWSESKSNATLPQLQSVSDITSITSITNSPDITDIQPAQPQLQLQLQLMNDADIDATSHILNKNRKTQKVQEVQIDDGDPHFSVDFGDVVDVDVDVPNQVTQVTQASQITIVLSNMVLNVLTGSRSQAHGSQTHRSIEV